MKRNKKYIVVSVVIRNIVIIIGIIFAISTISSNLFGSQKLETTSVQVQSGDSLWSISSKISEKNNENIQNIIIMIKNINNLSSNAIYAGQWLEVPNIK